MVAGSEWGVNSHLYSVARQVVPVSRQAVLSAGNKRAISSAYWVILSLIRAKTLSAIF